MNLRLVSRFVGTVAGGVGLAMFLPALVGIYEQQEKSAIAFSLSAAIALSLAIALVRIGKKAEDDVIGPREAIGVVGFGWLLAGILGGLPFLLDGATNHPIDAIFESVSGFTTTGATVFADLDTVSRASLLWRSLTHWLGGMGIIVLFVAVFPQLGVGARHLLSSEVPGPITERLRPRMKQTAIRLWWIYAGLTTLLFALLWMAGMTPFDAINHAFATLATGGFSTQNSSVGAYDSTQIDIIITIFMLLAGINFGLYHLVLQGRVRDVLRDTELRIYLALYVVVTAVITLSIIDLHGGNVAQALRNGAFQTASIQTTTGFGTDDFESYPAISRILLFMMMFIGGSAGSTAGGIKVGRVMILAKAAFRELRQNLRPQEVRALRVGNKVVPEGTLRSIAGFITLFFLTYILATIAVAACGLDAETAGSSVVASLGNIGPGFGAVGPTDNYAELPYMVKTILTMCMLLGRLELMTLLAFLLPGAWRKT